MDRSSVKASDRADAYRKSGWTTYNPTARPYSVIKRRHVLFAGSRRLGGENHGAKLSARDISQALACFEADLRLLFLLFISSA